TAASRNGMSGGSGTHASAATTVSVAKAAGPRPGYTSPPSASRAYGRLQARSARSHSHGSPCPHHQHSRHGGAQLSTTGSPGAGVVTPSPTAVTRPAPSWPRTTGIACASVPLASDRSEWHTPVAYSATRTWPGPGAGRSISSTRGTPPGVRSTAAATPLIGVLLARGRAKPYPWPRSRQLDGLQLLELLQP